MGNNYSSIDCDISRMIYSQIIPKSEHNGIKIKEAGLDDFNVIVILMESISRLTWLRHCPDIHKYLTQELGKTTDDQISYKVKVNITLTAHSYMNKDLKTPYRIIPILTIGILTFAFLLSGAVMLHGHNKVGDNTIPNVYAVLKGTNIFSDLKTLVFSGLDHMNFIFQQFAQKGCVLFSIEKIQNTRSIFVSKL